MYHLETFRACHSVAGWYINYELRNVECIALGKELTKYSRTECGVGLKISFSFGIFCPLYLPHCFLLCSSFFSTSEKLHHTATKPGTTTVATTWAINNLTGHEAGTFAKGRSTRGRQESGMQVTRGSSMTFRMLLFQRPQLIMRNDETSYDDC